MFNELENIFWPPGTPPCWMFGSGPAYPKKYAMFGADILANIYLQYTHKPAVVQPRTMPLFWVPHMLVAINDRNTAFRDCIWHKYTNKFPMKGDKTTNTIRPGWSYRYLFRTPGILQTARASTAKNFSHSAQERQASHILGSIRAHTISNILTILFHKY